MLELSVWVLFFVFFFKGRGRKQEKETEKTSLPRNDLWILAVEKAARDPSGPVTFSVSCNFSELHLTLRVNRQALCPDLFSQGFIWSSGHLCWSSPQVYTPTPKMQKGNWHGWSCLFGKSRARIVSEFNSVESRIQSWARDLILNASSFLLYHRYLIFLVKEMVQPPSGPRSGALLFCRALLRRTGRRNLPTRNQDSL